MLSRHFSITSRARQPAPLRTDGTPRTILLSLTVSLLLGAACGTDDSAVDPTTASVGPGGTTTTTSSSSAGGGSTTTTTTSGTGGTGGACVGVFDQAAFDDGCLFAP